MVTKAQIVSVVALAILFLGGSAWVYYWESQCPFGEEDIWPGPRQHCVGEDGYKGDQR